MLYCRPPGKARRGPGSAAPAEVVGSKRSEIRDRQLQSSHFAQYGLRSTGCGLPVLARRKATAGRAFGALTDPLGSAELPTLADGHEANSDQKRGPHRDRLDPATALANT